jgi:hypothetical protein
MVKMLSLARSFIGNLLASNNQPSADQSGWQKLQNKNYYNRPRPERHPEDSYLELYQNLGPSRLEYEWWALIMANRLSALRTESSKIVDTDMMLLIRQVKDDITKELSDLWSADDTKYILSKTGITIFMNGQRDLSKYNTKEWTQQNLSGLNRTLCGFIIDMLVLHGIVSSSLDAGDYHDLGTYVRVKLVDHKLRDWPLYDSVLLSRYIVSKSWSRIIKRAQGVIDFCY